MEVKLKAKGKAKGKLKCWFFKFQGARWSADTFVQTSRFWLLIGGNTNANHLITVTVAVYNVLIWINTV